MIRLKLSNKSANEGVNLDLPATPAEIGEAFSWFERIGVDLSTVRIAGVNSPIPTLGQYLLRADIHDSGQMKMLNELADSIAQMDDREWNIFAGALDAESINGLGDVLQLSKRLGDYIILPNVRTDTELGRILVDTGYKNFPEAVQPYLDYRAIGAEYYAENGGAYGPGGYVRRKTIREQAPESRDALISLHMATPTIYLHPSCSKPAPYHFLWQLPGQHRRHSKLLHRRAGHPCHCRICGHQLRYADRWRLQNRHRAYRISGLRGRLLRHDCNGSRPV